MYYEPLQDDEPSYAEQCRREVERRRIFYPHKSRAEVPRKVEEVVVAFVPEQEPPADPVAEIPERAVLPERLAARLSMPVKPASIMPRLTNPSDCKLLEVPSHLAASLSAPFRPGDKLPSQKQVAAAEAAALRIWLADIKKAVAAYYDISEADITGRSRKPRISATRHIAMYLAKTLTSHSYPEIGRRFGGRDHSTILHGVHKIKYEIEVNADLRAQIEDLTFIIQSRGSWGKPVDHLWTGDTESHGCARNGKADEALATPRRPNGLTLMQKGLHDGY